MTTRLAAAPYPVPIAPVRAEPPGPRLRRVQYEPEPGALSSLIRSEAAVPAPAQPAPIAPVISPAEFAEAHRCVTRALRIALEVLDGRRSPAHLAGHLDPAVIRYWRAAAEQRHVRSPARFSRIRLCIPRPGVAEVAVACHMDGRVRALAARFERADPQPAWRCTALRLG